MNFGATSTGGGESGGAGATESGGSSSTGGTATDGGTGGAGPTGGVSGNPTGGTGGTGGTVCTNIRPTGTEWDEATCDDWATQTSECDSAWMIENDYCNESCGRCSSSGTGGTATGSGGTGGTTITDSCTEPDKTVCNNESNVHCGYTYEYWKDQGSGCMTNKSGGGFSVEWSDINNLLGRKGRRPGSRNQVVTYDADYQPNGNSYLCIYGWTRNPLVEYYIVDSWGDWRPPGGEGHVGTVSSDGGTYDLYRIQKTGPTIEGDKAFTQYWSVRTEKRTSGTITVANHFDAWENAGMSMGSLYEVSMCVEGYRSSGTADVRMSMN
ncbi:MAG: glycoside hydrolase family 11 protein [Polyangiaceae bacterium]|nr:glycoside hydrolase family 11 protein [Polyangiaceae bacterium]